MTDQERADAIQGLVADLNAEIAMATSDGLRVSVDTVEMSGVRGAWPQIRVTVSRPL